MNNLEGQITILINEENTSIEITDKNSRITFAKLTLTPEQLSAALSKLYKVDCELEVKGLDKVGKKHENDVLEFELPKGFTRQNIYSEELQKIAQTYLDNGWEAQDYFGSKNSFFTQDGKKYARCTIRRWI